MDQSNCGTFLLHTRQFATVGALIIAFCGGFPMAAASAAPAAERAGGDHGAGLRGVAPASVQRFGGHGLGRETRGCASDADDQAFLEALAVHGVGGGDVQPVAPRPYAFFPHAVNLWQDAILHSFVDVDPSSGSIGGDGKFRDWGCSDNSYDGHQGQDSFIRGFAEQAAGVPVFAAEDGIVFFTHDGEDDRHIACAGMANQIALDHGNGHRTRYLHFKRGSVAVSQRQFVPAGTEVGRTGSSGCTFWPHLHFESQWNRRAFEPSTGPCNEGESGWVEQTPNRREFFVWDVGLYAAPADIHLPFEVPRQGSFAAGMHEIGFWTLVVNLPAESTYRLSLRAPSGRIEAKLGNLFLSSDPLRLSWWWAAFSADLDELGTWHLLLDFDGAPTVEAPFEVFATEAEVGNRAPHPVNVRLDPEQPSETDAVFCRVSVSQLFDDPDYDLVLFRYQWTVDGAVVRDVTHAGQADALARSAFSAGQTLGCTVTPADGVAAGPDASVTAEILPTRACLGDCDRSHSVTVDDIVRTIDVALGAPVTTCLGADRSGDGEISVEEIITVVGNGLSGCPPRDWSVLDGYERIK